MATPRLVELIDRYKKAHGVSEAELARRIGVSRENLRKWRTNGVSRLPDRANLAAVARVIGRPYRQVLSAALFDTGYLTDSQAVIPRPYDEVLHDAINVLNEASRLTNQPMRQTSSGQWEADPDPRAALRIDWAAFVTEALAGAAANAGGIDTILAGRAGSWEASVVGDALRAAVGHDEWDLWRHRTEPVTVVLNPERILFDNDASNYFDELDAAEAEIQRRESAIRPGIIYSYDYSYDADPKTSQWAVDQGTEVRPGAPPPLPTAEELAAAIAAYNANPTPLSPAEQAEQDTLAALEVLRGRVSTLQRAELAEYGDRLAVAVRTQLAALQLPVPVTVTVDLDTPWDQAPETPTEFSTTNAIDNSISAAIAATPTPDTLAGTLLERAEASLHRDRTEPDSE
jgi:transcriptional regulator with XRE-family HTH domain